MAFADTTWYCNAGDQSTTGYYAVAKRPQNTAVVAGQLVRPFTTPTVGQERVYVCYFAGTTANTTDASWSIVRGSTITDGTAKWMEVTGVSSMNGDLTNTPTWAQAKAGGPSVGVIIKRSNGASYQMFTTNGTMGGSEPAFSDTAGVTTNDGTAVWTSLGPVTNFTGGQAPHARLANACATNWFAAGNTIYVGDNHAESQATAITITPTLIVSAVGKIICHNHSGAYPPASTDLRTTATISTTAAVSITLATSNGSVYVYGLTFKVGVGASSTCFVILSGTNAWEYYDSCSFQLATTIAGASTIQIGSGTASVIVFNNTTVSFGNALHRFDIQQIQFIWQNTGAVLATGSSVPTQLITSTTAGSLRSIVLEALDLSQLAGAIVGNNSSTEMGNILIKDCKLNASGSILAPSLGETVQLVRCDSTATAYKSARYQYEGTETTETSITRVGGAADPTGQAQSRKIVTTANVQWLRPFKAEPYAIWNPTTGSNVTVTVCGTVNAGALPNNDDIWLEVEYLGSATSPLGNIVTTTKANLLAANAAVASDSSTWNGGGSGAGWSPFKLVAMLSVPQPGLAGYLHARVRVAAPTMTCYIDPLPVLN